MLHEVKYKKSFYFIIISFFILLLFLLLVSLVFSSHSVIADNNEIIIKEAEGVGHYFNMPKFNLIVKNSKIILPDKVEVFEDGWLRIKIWGNKTKKFHGYLFTNISSALFIINQSKISYAKIKSKGALYNFSDNLSVRVDDGTTVFYKDGKILVKGKVKFNFLNYNLQLKSDDSRAIMIGNTLICNNFEVNGVKFEGMGKITFGSQGIIINRGEAFYKSMKIETPNVMISRVENPTYKNWIYADNNKISIHADDDVKVRFLPGNDLLLMKEYVMDNGRKILRPDQRDYLTAELKKGAEINIESRKSQGLIPSVNSNNVGNAEIENGNLKIKVDDKGVWVKSRKLNEKDLLHWKESVPLEIKRKDSDKTLLVSSSNHYVLVDKNDNSLVTTQDYEVPVSRKIKDNMMQNFWQLKEKWENQKKIIKFEVKKGKGYDENDVTPYTVQLLDKWLSDHEQQIRDKMGDFDRFMIFNSLVTPKMSQEYAEGFIFNAKMIRRINLDENYLNIIKTVREANPYRQITHEFIHSVDAEVTWEEEHVPHKKGELRLDTIYDQLVEQQLEKLRQNKEYLILCREIHNRAVDISGKGKKVKALWIGPNLLENWYGWYHYPKLKELLPLRKRALNIVEQYLPAGYSAFESRGKALESVPISAMVNVKIIKEKDLPVSYPEMPTTFIEEPLKMKIRKANSDNKDLSGLYRKMTQIAFDTDQITAQQYKAIMKVNCRTPQCFEYKCKAYKIVCCSKYKNVPECK